MDITLIYLILILKTFANNLMLKSWIGRSHFNEKGAAKFTEELLEITIGQMMATSGDCVL